VVLVRRLHHPRDGRSNSAGNTLWNGISTQNITQMDEGNGMTMIYNYTEGAGRPKGGVRYHDGW
jgi:hypothetical protein